MSKTSNLTRRQRAVIEDLFTAQMDEQEVLDKHKVSQALYSRWLTDECFVEQFERRMAQARRSGRLVLARYMTVAASKLVALTDSEQEETARKACLDIITLNNPAARATTAKSQTDPAETELPPETASRLLAALAAGGNDPSDAAPRA